VIVSQIIMSVFRTGLAIQFFGTPVDFSGCRGEMG